MQDKSTDKQTAIAARRAYLQKHYATTGNAELATALGVTAHIIKNDANALRLQKTHEHRSKASTQNNAKRKGRQVWTEAMEQELAALYPCNSSVALALHFGMPARHIAKKAYVLGIKKDKDAMPKPEPKPRQTAKPKLKPKPAAKAKPAEQERTHYQVKGPPPMTAEQRAKKEKERFTYAPGALPWRAAAMLGPAWVPPPLSYRGQTA